MAQIERRSDGRLGLVLKKKRKRKERKLPVGSEQEKIEEEGGLGKAAQYGEERD